MLQQGQLNFLEEPKPAPLPAAWERGSAVERAYFKAQFETAVELLQESYDSLIALAHEDAGAHASGWRTVERINEYLISARETLDHL